MSNWLWPVLFVAIIGALVMWPPIHSWLRRRARIRQDRQHFERLKQAARREQ